MKKNYFLLFIILFWILSLLLSTIWGYSNPEKIEILKSFYKKNKKPDLEIIQSNVKKIIANSFYVELSQIISLSEKTAFIVYEDNNSGFDENKLQIYTQNGYLIKNLKPEKLKLPGVFTMQRNGGVKTIFIYKNNKFALISSSKINCFYASIVSLKNGNEIFKTKCLPGDKKNTDFNGLGSSNVHHNNYIYLSVGAPEQSSSKISALAQDINSKFGKILEINKKNLDIINIDQENGLDLKIFTMGHRNPQGLTKIDDSIFSVEHGPLGGDELNKIIKNKNYGWPAVSYGTKYLYDEKGKSYDIDHQSKGYEEPLFALTPSVGISALNRCPLKLRNFYKKPCLIALSLMGNNLRPGKSIIIFLLNKQMNKVYPVEQIFLGEEYRFRHFVTDSNNSLYEDENGSIYVSADQKGIYKIDFLNFR